MSPTQWAGTIRLARDEDGPKIGQLYADCQWADHGVNWKQEGLGQWWIVGEKDGRIVGAIQVMAAKPFGYVGDMVVHPSERGQTGNGGSGLSQNLGLLARILYAVANTMLAQSGVEVAMGVISTKTPALQRVMEKYGMVSLGQYHLMARRTQ